MIKASGKIQGFIDDLTTMNREFRTEVDTLDSTHVSLTQNWTGKASETFHTRYQQEKQGFDNFAIAIDEYIQALQNILANYTDGENQATDVAAGSR